MPAVDIKRFNRDTAGLLQSFGQPAVFLTQLRSIFELYSNRTIRPRPGPLSTSLQTFQIPLPILRHLDILLAQKVMAEPKEAVDVINALWADGAFECRLLAAMMLGKVRISSDQFEEMVTGLVQDTRDIEILENLLTIGMKRFRTEEPDKFLGLMFRWCATHDDTMTERAFFALVEHVRQDQNLNLPEIINIVTLPVRSLPQAFQNMLIDLICAVYDHSETETVYFIKQLFMEPFHKMMPVVFRRILNKLPEGIQPAVVDLLREKAPLIKK